MKIEDYGFIGDMRGAALVGRNGSIDWLCMPRFDSDAVCCALLGTEQNGFWKIAPEAGVVRTQQRYRGATVVLETEFATETGLVRVVDFMPLDGPHAVVRRVEGVEGAVRMRSELSLRADYGRCGPWLQRMADDGAISAVAGPDAWVFSVEPPHRAEILEGNIISTFTLGAGEHVTCSLVWHPSFEEPRRLASVDDALGDTLAFWMRWADRCTYRGPWREQVLRSLLTLKALTFSSTGGIVAAATTSLPELIGGVRNWDYRFCWLRDATFTLLAFMDTGYTDEAAAWIDWLLRAVAGDPGQLQIMYGVAGERRLKETTLPHLRGYENSAPVRIGNAAAEQFQLDVYGEVADALHMARKLGLPTSEEAWKLECALIEFVCENWIHPDDGIWEIRGPRRHFTHSKMMAWVTLDRAVKAVLQFGLRGDAGRWSRIRDEIHADICAKGIDQSRGCFTQYYGSSKLDASLLMMPLVGFLPPTDPRVIATVKAIEQELTHDGMVHRYHPDQSTSVDGLPPGEGTFIPCSFWLVDCFAQMGEHERAAKAYERLLQQLSPLGLLAEEYDQARGRLVGNFPQAFSHIGLINSAQNLTRHGPVAQRVACD